MIGNFRDKHVSNNRKVYLEVNSLQGAIWKVRHFWLQYSLNFSKKVIIILCNKFLYLYRFEISAYTVSQPLSFFKEPKWPLQGRKILPLSEKE